MSKYYLILNYLLLALVPNYGYKFKFPNLASTTSKKHYLSTPYLKSRTRALSLDYKKAQLVAFEINTAPKTDLFNNYSKFQSYVGIEDAFQDMKERVELVGKVLTKAAKEIPKDTNDPEVLKVFLLPEFFFRGNKGAYPVETILGNRRGIDTSENSKDSMWLPEENDKDLTLSLPYLLANLVKGEEWKDWLCVFGTVLGCRPLPYNQIIEATEKELAAVNCPKISVSLNDSANALAKFTGFEVAASKFINIAAKINKTEFENSIKTAVNEIKIRTKKILSGKNTVPNPTVTRIDYAGLSNDEAKNILSSECIEIARGKLVEVSKELEEAEQFLRHVNPRLNDNSFLDAKNDMLNDVGAAKPSLYKAAIENDYEIFNVALVQKGGWDLPSPPVPPEPFRPPNSFSVIKASVSGIDFIRYVNVDSRSTGYITLDNSQNLKEGNTPEKLRSTIEIVGNPFILDKLYVEDDNVFLIDDIVVGVEVCLDHKSAGGVLMQFRNQSMNASKRDSPKNVQIHIVTSCGMDLIPKNILIRDGLDTLAFSCDGSNNIVDNPLTEEGVIPEDNGKYISSGANSRASVWNQKTLQKFSDYKKSPPSSISTVYKTNAFADCDDEWKKLYNPCEYINYSVTPAETIKVLPTIRIFEPADIPAAGATN